ncbi:Uncharacterised protein [Mycobacteroides abscessus subsp. massiliense]|uniref:hypothetical protein n=1 Tax=Mycobacteroides abscessus TaxID=36809 RepID=UPI0009A7A395|nr:hypothetical protein [Mycobacteroides abscessus]SLC04776.1 Uncharacterised protein [Mycobacteroides abscessus subsp. massiliense]
MPNPASPPWLRGVVELPGEHHTWIPKEHNMPGRLEIRFNDRIEYSQDVENFSLVEGPDGSLSIAATREAASGELTVLTTETNPLLPTGTAVDGAPHVEGDEPGENDGAPGVLETVHDGSAYEITADNGKGSKTK